MSNSMHKNDNPAQRKAAVNRSRILRIAIIILECTIAVAIAFMLTRFTNSGEHTYAIKAPRWIASSQWWTQLAAQMGKTLVDEPVDIKEEEATPRPTLDLLPEGHGSPAVTPTPSVDIPAQAAPAWHGEQPVLPWEQQYAQYREEVPIGALSILINSGDATHISYVLHPQHLSGMFEPYKFLVFLIGGEQKIIELSLKKCKSTLEKQTGAISNITYAVISKTQINFEKTEAMRSALSKRGIEGGINCALTMKLSIHIDAANGYQTRTVTLRVFKQNDKWYIYPDDFAMNLLLNTGK